MCGAGDQFLQNVVGCVLKGLVKKKKILFSYIVVGFGVCLADVTWDLVRVVGSGQRTSITDA